MDAGPGGGGLDRRGPRPLEGKLDGIVSFSIDTTRAQLELGHRVAIKFLRDEMAANPIAAVQGALYGETLSGSAAVYTGRGSTVTG